MSFYEQTALVAALFHLGLTVFVLSRDLRSRVNWVYGVWGASLTLWNFMTFLKFNAHTPQEAIWDLRLLHLGLVFLPVSIFHLFVLIARLSKTGVLWLLYILHSLLAISIFIPGLYIADIKQTEYGPIVLGGAAFKIYTLSYAAIALVTIAMLIMEQRRTPPLHRRRLRSLLIGYVVLVAFGTHDLLLVFGIRHYPGTRVAFFPLGNLAAIIFGVAVAYSVLQHQLLNIQVTLSRVAAQLVRIVFMFLAGFGILITLRWLSPEHFSSYSFFSGLVALLLTAALTSILFPRFFGKGEEKLERRILGDRFEYQDRVRGFIGAIPFYGESDLLMADLHHTLVSTIKIKTYQIILLDEMKRNFTILRSQPPAPREPVAGLTMDSAIFRYFRFTQAEYLAYKLAYAMPGETEMERAGRNQLREYDPEFCFPLTAEGAAYGLLLIGEKASGEPYTLEDRDLLIALVKNLGLMLNQIRLKKQLLVAEEMELLGTMSRGMAHDMNNLITPVWTYLQLAQAGLESPEMKGELLPTAMRNIQTLREYIKESLFFSKTQSLQLKTVQMDKVIQSAVELTQPALKKQGINLAIQAPEGVEASVDEVLIQRLIKNLVSNAIDASPAGSQIRVELVRLARTDASRDWLRLRVIDQGEGISPENLKRVATPYFTTKDRGSSSRGFGLGLAICRKIVHLHGGQLTIDSELNKGTTVQVDLPSRQLAPAGPTVAFSS